MSCTEEYGSESNFITVELDRVIDDFVVSADMSVDDLGYDLESIIRCHSRYRHGDPADRITRLTDELHSLASVSNQEDAHTLAHLAVRDLYPAIDQLMRNMGFLISAIYEVDLYIKPGRKIRCTAKIAVV